MLYLLLFIIATLPVAGLLIFIYFQDKYQKEPIGTLCKAFFGGFLAIVIDLIIVLIFKYTLGLIPWFKDTVFYSSFVEAGIPEEFSKFLIFMLFIWRNKNFDEYFDGIVYACFIGLGFAWIENILYVFENGIGNGIVRAILSVPGHFLFGVVLGYFLSLAKFEPEKKSKHILTGLLLAMAIHGLFDWILMFCSNLISMESEWAIALSLGIYLVFLGGDVLLWIFGVKLIRKHQKNSFAQAQTQTQAEAIAQAQTDDTSNNPIN